MTKTLDHGHTLPVPDPFIAIRGGCSYGRKDVNCALARGHIGICLDEQEIDRIQAERARRHEEADALKAHGGEA